MWPLGDLIDTQIIVQSVNVPSAVHSSKPSLRMRSNANPYVSLFKSTSCHLGFRIPRPQMPPANIASPKPPSIKSPRSIQGEITSTFLFLILKLAKKSVRFPHYTHNDTRSIGAKSAPVINRRSDNETEPSDDEQVTSDNSSQESGLWKSDLGYGVKNKLFRSRASRKCLLSQRFENDIRG